MNLNAKMKAMNTHTTTKRNTEEKIVLLGSCFANEIGKKLQEEENWENVSTDQKYQF